MTAQDTRPEPRAEATDQPDVIDPPGRSGCPNHPDSAPSRRPRGHDDAEGRSHDDGQGWGHDDEQIEFVLPSNVVALDGLPDHVADWLVQAIDAIADRAPHDRVVDGPAGPRRRVTARSTTVHRPTIEAGGPDPIADPFAARQAAGHLIRVARGVQAWAEHVELEATRRLLAAVECDPDLDLGQHDAPSRRTTRAGLARTAVATELQVLTGLPITQCRDRVALAAATDERAGYLRARVASGTTSLHRACTVLKDTRHLDPLTADQIARTALRPIDGAATSATDPTVGGHRAYPRFVADPARAAAPGAHACDRAASGGGSAGAADRDGAPDGDGTGGGEPGVRHEGAILDPSPTRPDGFASETAALVGLGGVSQDTFRKRLARSVAGALPPDRDAERVHREAKAGRDLRLAPGQDGVSYLDLTAESDRVFAAHERIDRIARGARQAGDSRTLAQLRADLTTDLLIHGNVPDDHLLGDAPPGRVHVVVSLATLLGLDDRVAEAPGRGFLTAAQVRRVAVRAGSTLRRIVTDPTTGAAIETSHCYVPTKAMREFVMARDGRCRAPGCERSPEGADLDHVREWRPGAERPADGATHPDNLTLLHRGHHNPKTRRWWLAAPGPAGALCWKTLTGQQFSTYPMRYDDPADTATPGAQISLLESGLAGLIEGVLDPQAPTAEGVRPAGRERAPGGSRRRLDPWRRRGRGRQAAARRAAQQR